MTAQAKNAQAQAPEPIEQALDGRWEPGPPLHVGRGGPAGAELDGAVYAAGGWTATTFQTALADVERLGAPDRTWQTLPPMPTARGNPAAAAIAGRFYVIGGFPPTGSAFDVVEAYDPVRNAWSAVAPLPSPRGGASAAAAGDRIYVAGGDDGSTTAVPLASVVAYSPRTGTWHPVAPMPTARTLLKLVELAGDLYAIGGVADGPFLDTVERYDPQRQTWHAVAPMRTGRGNPGVAAVAGHIVVVGGAGGGPDATQALASSEVYDPAADSWTPLKPLLPVGRASLISASLPGFTILAIGGFPLGGSQAGSAEVDTLQTQQ